MRSMSAAGLVGVRLGGEDAELVAALANDGVLVAHGLGERVGHLPQELVADRVPERVVDLLEPVEVDDDERQRPAVAAVARELVAEQPFEQAVVAHAGQRVAAAPRARARPSRLVSRSRR